ncbi:cytochrome P450 [Amycolatopsis sp. GM8]|uniref:cytochrome P450 n=1 Tax=Amycolatopsis sp. GM8 TaxID=2896530 RepID=UPI001F2E37A1|nr:cytochrome P450 [Amycolatopsis sp. GM8]
MTSLCPHLRPAGRSEPDELELLSPAQVADPYPAYEQLRAQAPLVEVPEHNLWLVTSYSACIEVLGDPDRFSSRESLSGRNVFKGNPDAAARLRGGPGYPRVPTLILTDPPEHTRYRKIVQRAFAPAQTVRRLTPGIRERVDELIDGFADRGSCDFVAEFAYPLPMSVISQVLGFPPEMLDTLKKWSDDFISAQAGNIPPDRVDSAAASTVEFEHYVSALLDERAAAADLHERPDFLSRLIVEGAGDDFVPALTRQEQLSLCQQLLVGGNETTTNLLGNAMHVLIHDLDLAQRLREDPSLVPDFVEEVLRYESPLQGLFRVTTRDTHVQGIALPAGAKLMVLFASANRDENVYSPAGFDPDRDNRSAPHLAFGRGAHACMGQSLARREADLAITRLLQRLSLIEPAHDNPAQPVELFGFHGHRSLAIRFTQA